MESKGAEVRSLKRRAMAAAGGRPGSDRVHVWVDVIVVSFGMRTLIPWEVGVLL